MKEEWMMYICLLHASLRWKEQQSLQRGRWRSTRIPFMCYDCMRGQDMKESWERQSWGGFPSLQSLLAIVLHLAIQMTLKQHNSVAHIQLVCLVNVVKSRHERPSKIHSSNHLQLAHPFHFIPEFIFMRVSVLEASKQWLLKGSTSRLSSLTVQLDHEDHEWNIQVDNVLNLKILLPQQIRWGKTQLVLKLGKCRLNHRGRSFLSGEGSQPLKIGFIRNYGELVLSTETTQAPTTSRFSIFASIQNHLYIFHTIFHL